ncbi:hypothetical protein GE09DRAFT_1172075 [Coniochaeta sp. 2T2.1]|nr:hypothetical protein GE09DRAFT_1172075 [Coniochaeta sp. 2T2.1]
MERLPPGGSVRRARELALAGLRPDQQSQIPRLPQTMEDDQPQIAQPSLNPRRPVAPPAAGPSRLPRPQAPPGSFPARDGQIGVAISRPTQVPQWPLAGPIASPAGSSDSEPYRPPPGKSQPPQRPPRPSRVPSILDGSKIQEHTPVFQYKPQSNRESAGQDLLVVPETPSSVSRPSTVSSVASIPDFPLPVQMPVAPPRRSVNLGPPPSARRGASSFYSNASYVSPIPEESPRSRSHASFASSAAMPDSWGSPSPGPSPQYPDAFYDDVITEEGNPYEDDAEESRLVRSASLGKRAKPVLVTTSAMPKETDAADMGRRPDPVPLQSGPFRDGTGFIEASTSSSGTLPTARTAAPPVALTADSILDAYSAASSTDPSNPSRITPSPQPPGSRSYSRLSAIRRPPQLDIDAVRKAQARGSLTSLPDLIRRATRLAASLEKGRRPASRMDLSDFPDSDDSGQVRERGLSFDGEKHQSGFSDMLAAFPPPAQAGGRRSFRESLRQHVQSWPLPLSTSRGQSNSTSQDDIPDSSEKKRRRCCGLPRWGFILVVIGVLAVVAAATVVPLEFLVLRKRNTNQDAQPALQQCQTQLNCQNGGTNVVNQGVCSCICTNGFTGSDCSSPAATGCTTTSLTGDTNITNVTLGEAIPRLIAQANANFSIPLSPTTILAKLNAGNLSCTAENALVTFDGRSTRLGDALEVVTDPGSSSNAAIVGDNVQLVADGVAYDIVTVVQDPASIVTPVPVVKNAAADVGFNTVITAPTTFSTYFGTTITFPRGSTTTITPTLTRTITTTIPVPTPTGGSGGNTPTGFTVTEEVLDFARVAVLFILQEDNLGDAETAQNVLQRLFTTASVGLAGKSEGVSIEQARNVTVGNGNSVDLVQYRVDSGGNLVGGRRSSSS